MPLNLPLHQVWVRSDAHGYFDPDGPYSIPLMQVRVTTDANGLWDLGVFYPDRPGCPKPPHPPFPPCPPLPPPPCPPPPFLDSYTREEADARFATKAQGERADSAVQRSEVVNTLDSTLTTVPASADTVRRLREMIEAISGITPGVVYAAPTLSIGAAGDVTVEVGDNVAVVVVPDWKAKDSGGCTKYSVYKDLTLIAESNTATPGSVNVPPFKATETAVTLRAKVDYAEGPIKNDADGEPYPMGHIEAGSIESNTLTVKGYRCAFGGALSSVEALDTSAKIRSLIAYDNPKVGDALDLTIAAGSKTVCMAVPANLVLDSATSVASGFNMLAGFVRTEVQVEGANGYEGMAYNVYTLTPDIPFNAADRYVFRLKAPGPP